jgi:hypothetical protein
MKKVRLFLAGAFLVLLCGCGSSFMVAAQSQVTSSTVIIFSPIKHRGEQLKPCVRFVSNRERLIAARGSLCDLYYGNLYSGDDWDWFQSAANPGQRSLVRDLGALDWNDSFAVPIVEPLPKLKPGEQRNITVDTSGLDGADGEDGADGDRIVRHRPSRGETIQIPPKSYGKPKVDPVFAKAILGHLYVIHVVDDVSDFYVLFRIEALERGDNCTISWRVVPTPGSQTVEKQ